jgi:5-hydroxyisourate hydrolase
MSAITSHVLDTSLGKPAAAVSVSLALLEGGAFVELGRGVTDRDGRIKQLLGARTLTTGLYRLSFEIGAHYRATGRESFYEQVEIQFHVGDPSQHYHVPLLLSPFGYSTYRGS